MLVSLLSVDAVTDADMTSMKAFYVVAEMDVKTSNLTCQISLIAEFPQCITIATSYLIILTLTDKL